MITDNYRFTCACANPSEHPSPMRRGTCVQCCGMLSPFWLSTDSTLNEFWDRLRMGMFYDEPSSAFDHLRQEATRREREGRRLYGLKYLSQNNLSEAVDELSDFCNYIFFDYLNTIRREGHDPDLDVTLTAVAKVVEAMEHLEHLRSRRRGAP